MKMLIKRLLVGSKLVAPTNHQVALPADVQAQVISIPASGHRVAGRWVGRGDERSARRSSLRDAIVLTVLACAASVASAQNGTHDVGSWVIRGTPIEARWVEIHQVERRNGTQLYHIEVLGRRTGNCSWEVLHLVPHMAITEAALFRSIRGPSRELGLYPETFDGAYVQWQQLNASGKAPICSRSVEHCMGR